MTSNPITRRGISNAGSLILFSFASHHEIGTPSSQKSSLTKPGHQEARLEEIKCVLVYDFPSRGSREAEAQRSRGTLKLGVLFCGVSEQRNRGTLKSGYMLSGCFVLCFV
ncbi:hypothetical protein Droror1_Dr00027870 [Drosera rotundifolia]